MAHYYGYIKDPPDDRDYLYQPTLKLVLPPAVDLRQYCSPVRDQGALGSCTGFSMATGLREFMLIKNNPAPPDPTPTPVPSCFGKVIPFVLIRKLLKYTIEYATMSPLFLYYCERALEGTVGWDAGATMRDGMKVLATTGVCPEIDWPYNISNFKTKPSAVAYANAIPYKITVYKRISTLLDIKNALAEGQGVVFGFNVYESFESNEVANTGNMPLPKPGERKLGGHAVFICGYIDDPTWAGGGYLIIKNSWGIDWGDKGYFYMPYAFVDGGDVDDIWTATV